MTIYYNELFQQAISSLERLKEGQKAIQEYWEAALKPLRESFAILHERNELLESQLNEIGARFQYYVENTPEHLVIIAQHGWFLDIESDLSMPSRIVNEITEKRFQEADDYIVEYYEKNLDSIKKELVSRHSKRRKIIEESFECHRQGNYYVSVPAFLSQVDGICFDNTGYKYFIGSERKKVIEEFEKLSGHIIEIFLSPIKASIPISATKKELSSFPCTLNRHEIMHGVITNYGTKTNSLKSISLLKYFSDALLEKND